MQQPAFYHFRELPLSSSLHSVYQIHHKFVPRHFYIVFLCSAHYRAADRVYFCTSAISQIRPDGGTAGRIVQRCLFHLFGYSFFIKFKTCGSRCQDRFMDQLTAQLPGILVCGDIPHIYLQNTRQSAQRYIGKQLVPDEILNIFMYPYLKAAAVKRLFQAA